ncbi:MAG: hypothetical protein RJA44_215 [Pseudomonadota bacterium]|jgi:PTS system ascorbate-specific IIA component
MARLLILAHAPLATALLQVARHAYPDLARGVLAFDVQPQASLDESEVAVRLLLQTARAADVEAATDLADEILVLTDVFGATPANVAQRLSDGIRMRVLAGVNVPMLWRALNYARLPLDELVTRAMAGANQGVLAVVSTRPQNQAFTPQVHDSIHHHHQQ